MSFERNTKTLEYGVPGFTSPAVLGFLNDIVTWARPNNCLEIGSYMGRSTTAIAKAMGSYDAVGKILCIDIFEQIITDDYVNLPLIRQITNPIKDNWAKYLAIPRPSRLRAYFDLTVSRFPEGEKYIEPMQGDSQSICLDESRRFQLAYLDGDHTFKAVTNDLILTLTHLDDGGIVIFDDVSDQFPGVKELIGRLRKIDAVEYIAEEFPDMALKFTSPETVRQRLMRIADEDFAAIDATTSSKGKN